MAQNEKPIRSGSPPAEICVAAAHVMARYQPQKVANSPARNADCNAIISFGLNSRTGSMRFRTALRPSPETTTQASAASGTNECSTEAKCGWYSAQAWESCTAATQGFWGLIAFSPVDSSGRAARICFVCIQQAPRSGIPKTQRQATSIRVSEGRANTQPI